ncbi:MAG: hypothetical protein JO189_30730 [Deltaproteobacteria bacterium]|nr:hypothetical protein [Deltaproteobacteria bacterium]
MEYDSVDGIVAWNRFSISERVSGSGHVRLYRLNVAPRAYQSSFVAYVLENDTEWIRFMPGSKFVSNLVGTNSGAIKCAMPVELVCAKSNSQVIFANFCPQGSS